MGLRKDGPTPDEALFFEALLEMREQVRDMDEQDLSDLHRQEALMEDASPDENDDFEDWDDLPTPSQELLVFIQRRDEAGARKLLARRSQALKDGGEPISTPLAFEEIGAALDGGMHDLACELVKKAYKGVVKLRRSDGATLAHIACRNGSRECLEMLLDHGADSRAGLSPPSKILGMSWAPGSGITPLMAAASANSGACVEELAKRWAPSDLRREMERRDERGEAAVHRACRAANSNALAALLKLFPDNAKILDREGRSPAQLAAAEGSLECLRALASCPQVDWAGSPKDGSTALMAALKSRSQECLQFMVRIARGLWADADPAKRAIALRLAGDKQQENPLVWACSQGLELAVGELIEFCMATKSEPDAKKKMLADCSATRDADVVARLAVWKRAVKHFAQGAQMAGAEFKGDFKIVLASRWQLFDQTIGALRRHRDNLAQGGAQKATAEGLAAILSQPWPAQKKRAFAGASLYGRTLFHEAASQGDLDSLNVLIGHFGQNSGEMLGRPDALGRTALALAAAAGSLACCERIFQDFPAPASPDVEGWTPFLRAVATGDIELAKAVEFAGARERRTFAGDSAAFIAANEGDSRMLAWLLKDADPNEIKRPSARGLNLLHCAASGGDAKCVELALGFCDPKVRDARGRTPLRVALDAGNHDALSILAPLAGAAESDLDELSPLQAAILGGEDQRRSAPLLALWIDPRSKPKWGRRWRKIFGPRVEALDAAELASQWELPELAKNLQSIQALWDAGQAPAQQARGPAPSPEPSPEPASDLREAAQTLARAAALAREQMAQWSHDCAPAQLPSRPAPGR